MIEKIKETAAYIAAKVQVMPKTWVGRVGRPHYRQD